MSGPRRRSSHLQPRHTLPGDWLQGSRQGIRLAADRRRPNGGQRPVRGRPEIPLFPNWTPGLFKRCVRHSRRRSIRGERPLAVALTVAEPQLQRDSAAASAPAATSTAAASAAGSGDADLPGRLGDSGDRYVPGSAAAASATARRAGRARLIRGCCEQDWGGLRPAPFFRFIESACARSQGQQCSTGPCMMVRTAGFEPALPNREEDFKSPASTVPPRPLGSPATVGLPALFRGHFL